MTVSTIFPASERQLDFHASVERQGLALGAARERNRRVDSILQDRQQIMELSIDSWENEGGAAAN